jgi:dTDP-4-amino-4,6-dideoxygalactose transaminase
MLMTDFKVPFVDLQQRFVEEGEELLACVERVLAKGHLVMTQEVSEFEQQVVEYTGAKYCVSCGNGTDGLMLALWALGVGKGDEVVTTPISFVASTGAIVHVGATPIYADVRADQNIDPAEIEKKITPRTKAILPVHWGGRIADMDAIMEIAKRHKLLVIEDSAQSMGAYYHGKHGGTFGGAGAISAHPLKNLNALGDGGMLLTNDEEVARKVRLYRNHGLQDRDTCVMYGVNSRLDVLNAEVLKFRLTRLDSVLSRRRRNVSIYQDKIRAKQVYIPPVRPHEQHAYVMFIVQAENRDMLKAHLEKCGVQTLVYYGTPLHLHPAAQRLGFRRGDLPVAEQQADRVLALPHHQHLTPERITFVANAVNEFYGA